MNETLLSVEKLNIQHVESGQTLVQEVSFSVAQGGRMTMLGQSGSGKTMSCRAILGLLNRRSFEISGTIEFDGISLLSIPERRRKDVYGKGIAFIPQNPMTALDPSRKVGHQVRQFLNLHKQLSAAEAEDKYAAALRETGLTQTQRILNSFPHQLSGGMLQRVLIALALAQNARLIIADEPTTALDAISRDQSVDLLCQIQRQGCAIFLVTHDFHVAKQLGGDVIVLKDGAAVETGGIEQILSAPQAAYTKELIAASVLDWR